MTIRWVIEPPAAFVEKNNCPAWFVWSTLIAPTWAMPHPAESAKPSISKLLAVALVFLKIAGRSAAVIEP
jgi:hypothetical protein